MAKIEPSILTVNGGSSSIRFALYEIGKPLKRTLHGKIDRIGLGGTNLAFKDATGNQDGSLDVEVSDHRSAVNFLIDWLEKQNGFASVRLSGIALSMG